MMLYHLLLVVLVVVTLGAHAQRRTYNNYPRPVMRRPRCTSPNIPCRQRLQVTSREGQLQRPSEGQACSCNFPNSCSSDWSRQTHVISQSLTSSTSNFTLSMMFCRPVQPRAMCTPGQSALVLSGYAAIPADLESYNCRCPDSQPLQLRSIQIVAFKRYNTYVCGSHVRTCAPDQACKLVGQERTEYHCRCPGSLTCSSPPLGRASTSAEGVCS